MDNLSVNGGDFFRHYAEPLTAEVLKLVNSNHTEKTVEGAS